MKAFNISLTISILICLFGCNSEKIDLDGHWHFSQLPEGLKYPNTIDIRDTLASLDEYFYSSIYPNCVIDRHSKIMNCTHYFIDGEYSYSLTNDTLIITSLSGHQLEIYKAYKDDNCLKWVDEFIECPVKFKLPITDLNFGKKEYKKSLTTPIFTGNLDGEIILANFYEPIKLEGIEELLDEHEKKVPEPIRPRMSVSIYSDKTTAIEDVQSIISEIRENNNRRIYLMALTDSMGINYPLQFKIDSLNFEGKETVQDLFN